LFSNLGGLRRQDPEIPEIPEISKILEVRESVAEDYHVCVAKKRQPSIAGQAERSGRETQRFPVGTCMAARDGVAAMSIRK
jgi:hypothetical protein